MKQCHFNDFFQWNTIVVSQLCYFSGNTTVLTHLRLLFSLKKTKLMIWEYNCRESLTTFAFPKISLSREYKMSNQMSGKCPRWTWCFYASLDLLFMGKKCNLWQIIYMYSVRNIVCQCSELTKSKLCLDFVVIFNDCRTANRIYNCTLA